VEQAGSADSWSYQLPRFG